MRRKRAAVMPRRRSRNQEPKLNRQDAKAPRRISRGHAPLLPRLVALVSWRLGGSSLFCGLAAGRHYGGPTLTPGRLALLIDFWMKPVVLASRMKSAR